MKDVKYAIYNMYIYINNNNLLMWVYVITVWILVVVALQIKKAKQPGSKKAKRVAFFHPFW